MQLYFFCNFGPRWGCVANVASRLFYPSGKRPDAHCTGIWISPRTGLDRGRKISRPLGFEPRDRSGLSKSLTEYAIPGPYWCLEIYLIDLEGRCYISVHLQSSSSYYTSQNIHFQQYATVMPAANKLHVSSFLYDVTLLAVSVAVMLKQL